MIFGKRQLYPYWRFMWHKHLHHVLMRHYGSKCSFLTLAPSISIVIALWFFVLDIGANWALYWKSLWWSRKSKQIRDDRKHAKKSDVLLAQHSTSTENRNDFCIHICYGKPILFCGFNVKPILCGIVWNQKKNGKRIGFAIVLAILENKIHNFQTIFSYESGRNIAASKKYWLCTFGQSDLFFVLVAILSMKKICLAVHTVMLELWSFN